MDANFLLAYKRTVANEGSLSNNPKDRGGLTWKGISRKMNPAWAGWNLVDSHLLNGHSVAVILQDTTLESQVQEFYYRSFWLKLRLNEITNPDTFCKYFDTAVNVGLVPATKFQQASVDIAQTGHVDDLLIKSLNSVV